MSDKNNELNFFDSPDYEHNGDLIFKGYRKIAIPLLPFSCVYVPDSPECETCIIKPFCPKRGKVEWQPMRVHKVAAGGV